jgi:hypothetical protein
LAIQSDRYRSIGCHTISINAKATYWPEHCAGNVVLARLIDILMADGGTGADVLEHSIAGLKFEGRRSSDYGA